MISQIAAMSRNRVIGVGNALPWHIPEDMKFFREKTRDKIIIMGRKTFESLGNKPLPKRLNIVITKQKSFVAPEDVKVFDSVERALEFANNEVKAERWPDEIMVIGGGEIYKAFLPYTDRIYLTVIDKDYEGDVRFPDFDLEKFQLIETKDRSEPVPFSFRTYQRQTSV